MEHHERTEEGQAATAQCQWAWLNKLCFLLRFNFYICCFFSSSTLHLFHLIPILLPPSNNNFINFLFKSKEYSLLTDINKSTRSTGLKEDIN